MQSALTSSIQNVWAYYADALLAEEEGNRAAVCAGYNEQ